MNSNIETVYRFKNGMCMVFDTNGEQMPECQGKWEEVKQKIINDLPEHGEITREIQWK